jgi:hypothetical protein
MYQAVVSVRPDEDFSLTVVFADGVQGVLDMTPYLDFGVFKRLKDFEQFRRVRIAFDTVEWDCGVDLDPEFIRAKCKIPEKVPGKGSSEEPSR